jgi:hypothetical protein
MRWRNTWMVGTLGLAAGLAAAAPPERRVLLPGVKGNAPREVKRSVGEAVRQGFAEAQPPKGYKVLDCAALYATLVGLGQDPDNCEQGKLEPDDFSLFAPRYVLAGEAMNVAGSTYVTVKVLDGNGTTLEAVSAQQPRMVDLLSAVRRDVKLAMARRFAEDTPRPTAAPRPPDVQKPAPADTVALATTAPPAQPPPPTANAVPQPAPTPPLDKGPPAVALVVTERPINATTFVWKGPSLWALSPTREQLGRQGLDVVDGTGALGSLSTKLAQDGTVSRTMAQQLFADEKLKQAVCLRLVYTDGGVNAGTREVTVFLASWVFDPPSQGKQRDHMELEQAVTCPESDLAECRRKVLETMVAPTVATLLRANPVR